MEETKNHFLDIIRDFSSPIDVLSTEIKPRLTLPERPKAVLFDVYGTLFISGSGDIGSSQHSFQTKAFEKAIRYSEFIIRKDLAEILPTLFIKKIKKTHEESRKSGTLFPEVNIIDIWQDTLHSLIRLGFIHGDITEDVVKNTAIRFETIVNPVWPMPGVEKLLSYLGDMPTITGIISNAQFFTPLLFSALLGKDITGYDFESDLLFWSYQFKEAKPSISLFQSAKKLLLSKYGIDSKETIYIGNDMLNDILPAQNIGFKTALFAGDKRSLRLRSGHAETNNIQPDVIVNNLMQFYDILHE